jgi:hypothetical protein
MAAPVPTLGPGVAAMKLDVTKISEKEAAAAKAGAAAAAQQAANNIAVS